MSALRQCLCQCKDCLAALQNPEHVAFPLFAFTARHDRLRREREALIAYLKAKTDAEDWHAVADAAMDIREVEAELRGMVA